MVKTNYDLNRTYERALDEILTLTGLIDLSLIEKVALRRISADALRRTKAMQVPGETFPPVSEAMAVFMELYYDTHVATQNGYSSLSRFRADVWDKYGEDRVGWYLQRQQDEMHLV